MQIPFRERSREDRTGMNYLRRMMLACFILAFIICAWYGAEMLLHGESQRSAVDIAVAVVISMSISGKIEKGVENNERKREFAEKFADEFIKHIKKGEEAENGENGSGKEG